MGASEHRPSEKDPDADGSRSWHGAMGSAHGITVSPRLLSFALHGLKEPFIKAECFVSSLMQLFGVGTAGAMKMPNSHTLFLRDIDDRKEITVTGQ